MAPGPSLAGYRLTYTLGHASRHPVLHRRPHCMHAIANIPAQCPGAFVARFPGHIRLPRRHGRVGLCINLFETCSAFTLVTACILAKSPMVILYTEGFSPPSLRGCSDCFRLERQFAGWGSHPQGRRAFPRRTCQEV